MILEISPHRLELQAERLLVVGGDAGVHRSDRPRFSGGRVSRHSTIRGRVKPRIRSVTPLATLHCGRAPATDAGEREPPVLVPIPILGEFSRDCRHQEAPAAELGGPNSKIECAATPRRRKVERSKPLRCRDDAGEWVVGVLVPAKGLTG
jgi:hypothetical protein